MRGAIGDGLGGSADRTEAAPDNGMKVAQLERGKTPMSNNTIIAEMSSRLHELLPISPPPAAPGRRLILKTDGRFILMDEAKVDWVESAGNYVCVHAAGATHIVRETLTRFAERLDPQQFQRIHRTTVINVARVRELLPFQRGDYLVILTDGTERILSRRYRDQFMADVTFGL